MSLVFILITLSLCSCTKIIIIKPMVILIVIISIIVIIIIIIIISRNQCIRVSYYCWSLQQRTFGSAVHCSHIYRTYIIFIMDVK